jgi:tripartite-type tricarboxylate transporter receptor subunit TctC
VVYKATGQYVQDLVGGHLQAGLNFWSVIGTHVKAGRLRALAVSSTQRLEAAPDVPTFAEAGLDGIVASSWQGVFVPAGTPREVATRLESELRRALRAPEVRNPILEQGGEVGGNSAQDFSAFLRAEKARWKKAVLEARLEPQ